MARKKKSKRRMPDNIHAVITKSNVYDGLLTIKVPDEEGELVPPRRAITKAGYKPGDKVIIIPEIKIKFKE